MNFRLLFLLILFGMALGVRADAPSDNLPDQVRRVPPPGLAIAAAARAELETGVAELGRTIDALPTDLKSHPALRDLLPDVEIFYKAVQWPLAYDEFYSTNDVPVARRLLHEGLERARQLREGQAPWLTATGPIVRGYRSRIDDSVQPYGLVVPASYQPNTPHRFRLDFWFHGRGETLTELNFINGRQKSTGEFAPPDTFVLHLYGRYCNANRFAGETDLFEAFDQVRKYYPIDENRLVVRGFSMGGAACWDFATHYAWLWAAAAPGAGFSETADFLKVFQNETLKPASYEQKLWHLYDATDYAVNLFNCPTVAYSGEIDKQKQAADIMEKVMSREGLRLTHIIGPGTAHAYHPDAKAEINRRIDSIVAHGRNPVPARVRLVTWTLRYNQMFWVQVNGLGRHWERARVDAEIVGDSAVRVTTENVTALTLSMPPGFCPLEATRRPRVILDGRDLQAAPVMSDRSWSAYFRKIGKNWFDVAPSDETTMRKRHELQGPIDDAFMDRFVMVSPTGKPSNEKVGAWVAAEEAHAIDHWRRQFRGNARVVNDDALSEADLATSNLVLWGDPASNKVLARIADKLPIHWDAAGVRVGNRIYSADHHVPLLIWPNPLNPKHYVVLNSGFTFREYDYLNNARQTPKLPDYAVIDVDVPVSSRAPGHVADAGFFGEYWELPASTR
ncbi:MAG: prolyl oligopeptidase family serine peptidase [Limisphaerales bacterium]